MTQKLANFIGGEFVPPLNGKYFDNINPTNQQVNNLVPDSNTDDAHRAIAAAKKALPAWRALKRSKRAAYLTKIAKILRERTQEFVEAESRDMGKPYSFLKNMDIPVACDKFEQYARHLLVDSNEYHQCKGLVSIEHRNALGVVALISPWNFPVMLISEKISAAIACGNTVVAKQTELAPTTAYLLCKVIKDAGLPAGVVNVIHGYGRSAGQPLVGHKDVRAISFTGGSVTGGIISRIAAPKLKKLQLELGGKNTSIVFDDCYFDETVAGCAFAGFMNTGQVCCSGSRLLVQRTIYDKFVKALVKHTKEVYMPYIGCPKDPKTMMGPLISRTHLQKVKRYAELARKEGGRFLCGGGQPKNLDYTLRNGNFFEPSIVVNLDHKCRCAQEEIFGPIITVHPFDTEKEAIESANSVDYGLGGSVWTSDIRRGQRVARQVDAGSVWINCWIEGDNRQPFGGFKNSGINREGGRHSMDFFTETKAIVSKL